MTVSVQAIIDAAEGTTPSFDYHKSLAQHLKDAQASISELQGGSAVGWGAPIDLRYYADDIGAMNAVSIIPQQEPSSGDTLTAGMFFWVTIAATNDGAATLEVRNTAGDVTLTSPIKTSDGSALAGGELQANQVAKLLYLTDGGALDEWRIVGDSIVIIANDLFNYLGAWSAGTYNTYDVVTNGGETWVANTTTTQEPTDAATDWDKLAAKGSMTNPMTTAGDMILATAGGTPARLAKGTTGRHMRAGASGPEYGGDVDMNGAVLNGNGAKIITEATAFSLNNTTHRGSDVIVSGNVVVTVDAQATTAYSTGHQSVIHSTNASGCTVTAAAGVTLNGVSGGSATINQYEAYSLLRTGSDAWLMPNATVS